MNVYTSYIIFNRVKFIFHQRNPRTEFRLQYFKFYSKAQLSSNSIYQDPSLHSEVTEVIESLQFGLTERSHFFDQIFLLAIPFRRKS